MPATFYWITWMVVIIACFFANTYIRPRLYIFLCLSMCLYNVPFIQETDYIFVQTGFFLLFGIYFWNRTRRKKWEHAWLLLSSIGYSAVWIIHIIHPVWAVFPGISLLLAGVVFSLRLVIRDLEGRIGLWIFMNAGGSLLSYYVFSLYTEEGLVESGNMMTLTMKGLFILFIIYGVERMKQSINKKKRSLRKKGSAFV